MTSAPAPKKKRRGGVVVPNAPRWHHPIGAWAIAALIHLVSATLRYRFNDQSGYFEPVTGEQRRRTSPIGPAIYIVWHNRLALSLQIYYGYLKKREQAAGLAALVSASRDGAGLAAVLECFDVLPVRGSSSKRGPQALLELTTWAERGYDLAITPDGPRGPRYVVQEGVMSLAQVTGMPIVPVSYTLPWKIQVKSWDRFQIPIPFSRCEVQVGEPVRVPREASDEERERLRQELEKRLRGLSVD
jgi:lysophospholipid acyltransferase (LPLAT)-like uncharacterized protein